MRTMNPASETVPDLDAPSASSTLLQAESQTKDDNNDTDKAASGWQPLPSQAPGYGEPAGMQLGNCATPAGLKNIGNTCYLNSVLQYFFTIKEVRDQVMEAATAIQRSEGSWLGGELRVGGRLVSSAEIERSRKFVVQLSNLFDNMITSPAAAVEPERELAYLALVSSRTEEAVLNTQVPDAKPLPDQKPIEPEVPKHEADVMPTDAQPHAEAEAAVPQTAETAEVLPATSLLNGGQPSAKDEAEVKLTAAPQEVLKPVEKVGGASQKMELQAQESLMQLGAQQDVGECLDNVVFQIEVGLRTAGAQPGPLSESQEQAKSESAAAAASLDSAIERLFVGISSQRVVPVAPAPDTKPSEPKREIFTLIPIDITHEGCDVYDGLDNFFDDEYIEGANVRRTVTLQEPPAILQIQAQRVQYDRLQGKAFKALTHLEVGEVISLDRYLELPDGHPNKAAHDARRIETAKLRTSEAEIAKNKAALFNGKVPVAETLRQLGSAMNAYAAKPGESGFEQGDLTALGEVLDAQSREVQSDVEKLEKEVTGLKAAREEIWKIETETSYELVAVFMHRGEATHGHYFLNQRRFPNPVEGQTQWLKYNDEQVCEATVQEVLKDSTGATPYLLIYVRRRPEPTATIDTVRRQIAGMNLELPPSINGPRIYPSPDPSVGTVDPAQTQESSTQAPEPSPPLVVDDTADTVMADAVNKEIPVAEGSSMSTSVPDTAGPSQKEPATQASAMETE
ncbi:unnamed protein product [Tilletia controversa]|uniref:Ubiquitin carboxyl-terminal hydrolase n=3 Tax=Tilletia TaxID=13289 RepID=A0A8X7N1E1_9BASI|nr:hypothetical protein CF336_g1011 [Tilletia laevis]KAE8203468.1 hypothetical protein CF328_g1637 [Tilletia controversa]KAE8264048.1 hypothetical protein A4X03_0g1230 [Tilletia caries]KAE8207526.1 hypothetical protein CF335_g1079 [Tilletia laevis]KAE8255470.1 hypothetical protein A4X06_0g409 [Tilletia controversa]